MPETIESKCGLSACACCDVLDLFGKQDIDKAYGLGAQLFLSKPEDFGELSKILEVMAKSSQESLSSQLKGYKNVKLA